MATDVPKAYAFRYKITNKYRFNKSTKHLTHHIRRLFRKYSTPNNFPS